MALKAEASLATGLATAVIVWAVHQNATPTMAEIRLSPRGDTDIDAARRQASWTAGAIVAAISLIARDATVFVIGGGMVVLLDWWARYTNEVDPDTGRATAYPLGRPGMQVNDPTATDAEPVQ
jgi:hypothetical protein